MQLLISHTLSPIYDSLRRVTTLMPAYSITYPRLFLFLPLFDLYGHSPYMYMLSYWSGIGLTYHIVILSTHLRAGFSILFCLSGHTAWGLVIEVTFWYICVRDNRLIQRCTDFFHLLMFIY